MMQIIVFLIVSLAALSANGRLVNFHNCKSLFTINSIDVEPCNSPAGENWCPLKRNTHITVTVNFTATKDVPSLRSVVNGVIGGLVTPFPLSGPDACVHSHIQCPIQAGTTHTYVHPVDVLASYPKVQALVRWTLQEPRAQAAATPDAANDKIQHPICFLIKARIVD